MDWEDLAALARDHGLTLPELEARGWRERAVWEFTLEVVSELTRRGLLPSVSAFEAPGCYGTVRGEGN
ncbi:hypothetical protein [Marinithermus hydrothermalis]|uniref:Uncharacterized protein n=1 Tax=Marinithermus hydrothermalis (strain DSM 14884 / JCM 11576 / T1) TaxID=869210 RepID=F2NP89_MARHT|nr:hypothetical protein [Marinithermus hydrothermalis]AEB11890.1 hypothetical protein Marky_1149 [Marinithermus hydrothermalis DSM 14884]